ncbi:hypothetical protein BVX98_03075, partial [bacterium F11]
MQLKGQTIIVSQNKGSYDKPRVNIFRLGIDANGDPTLANQFITHELPTLDCRLVKTKVIGNKLYNLYRFSQGPYSSSYRVGTITLEQGILSLDTKFAEFETQHDLVDFWKVGDKFVFMAGGAEKIYQTEFDIPLSILLTLEGSGSEMELKPIVGYFFSLEYGVGHSFELFGDDLYLTSPGDPGRTIQRIKFEDYDSHDSNVSPLTIQFEEVSIPHFKNPMHLSATPKGLVFYANPTSSTETHAVQFDPRPDTSPPRPPRRPIEFQELNQFPGLYLGVPGGITVDKSIVKLDRETSLRSTLYTLPFSEEANAFPTYGTLIPGTEQNLFLHPSIYKREPAIAFGKILMNDQLAMEHYSSLNVLSLSSDPITSSFPPFKGDLISVAKQGNDFLGAIKPETDSSNAFVVNLKISQREQIPHQLPSGFSPRQLVYHRHSLLISGEENNQGQLYRFHMDHDDNDPVRFHGEKIARMIKDRDHLLMIVEQDSLYYAYDFNEVDGDRPLTTPLPFGPQDIDVNHLSAVYEEGQWLMAAPNNGTGTSTPGLFSFTPGAPFRTEPIPFEMESGDMFEVLRGKPGQVLAFHSQPSSHSTLYELNVPAPSEQENILNQLDVEVWGGEQEVKFGILGPGRPIEIEGQYFAIDKGLGLAQAKDSLVKVEEGKTTELKEGLYSGLARDEKSTSSLLLFESTDESPRKLQSYTYDSGRDSLSANGSRSLPDGTKKLVEIDEELFAVREMGDPGETGFTDKTLSSLESGTEFILPEANLESDPVTQKFEVGTPQDEWVHVVGFGRDAGKNRYALYRVNRTGGEFQPLPQGEENDQHSILPGILAKVDNNVIYATTSDGEDFILWNDIGAAYGTKPLAHWEDNPGIKHIETWNGHVMAVTQSDDGKPVYLHAVTPDQDGIKYTRDLGNFKRIYPQTLKVLGEHLTFFVIDEEDHLKLVRIGLQDFPLTEAQPAFPKYEVEALAQKPIDELSESQHLNLEEVDGNLYTQIAEKEALSGIYLVDKNGWHLKKSDSHEIFILSPLLRFKDTMLLYL